MSQNPTLPRVLSLIVADSVFYDEAVNKYFILGTYHAIRSHRFPAIHDRIAFYLAVDNVRTEVILTLKLVDADESRPVIFEGQIPFKASGPNEVREIALRMPIQPRFESPGQYRLEVWLESEMLYARRFSVDHWDQTQG